ncbi:hypothetical protein V0U79_04400 [Hyphobacterium sp. HN65]|uniref:Uncharacterized protein n=1 Tax=Hyphobacterium lacteum TaxID=3116575 RepID=A0ABU7LNU6_9PROT|nr:hypothetical protein [Hyphobacterium sp. HN65]MEE2525596.1 hypothetical protein [Hyphobacterium sp. HN65]
MISRTLFAASMAALISAPALADIWECEFGQAETEAETGLISTCSHVLHEVIDTEIVQGCENELPDERVPIRNLVLNTVSMEARWEEHRQRPPHLRPERVEWLMERGVTREQAEDLAARVNVFPFEGFLLSHTVSSGHTYGDPITDEYVQNSPMEIEHHTFVFHEPWEQESYQLLSDGLTGHAYLIEPIREGTGSWLEIRYGQCTITETPGEEPADADQAED